MARKNYAKGKRTTLHIAPSTPYIAPTPHVACREKRRFHTEKTAKEAADIQTLQHINLELDVYQCNYCRGWHLTRKKLSTD